MRRLRIATRRSELALAQARAVAERIERQLGMAAELLPLETSGDRLPSLPLADIGGKGLFVKEIEAALLDGRAELAVHSAKDLPSLSPPELVLAAFPERADPRDALVAREPGITMETLPRGARVGTGSARRRALLLWARPDLAIVPLRGNVPTRLRKLAEEKLDAVVLACAGLDRLGLADRISERIPSERILPAVAQGVLALQVRADSEWCRMLSALDDASVRVAATAERGFLERVGGDCYVPLAAHAVRVAEGKLRLRGLVAAPDGRAVVAADEEAEAEEAARLGRQVAETVLARGGAEILARFRAGKTG